VFCPLCKAEFRDGFTECSDCHIALVALYAEAESVGADRLWDGDDRKKCGRILDALLAAGIPYHSKELLKKNPGTWISIFLWQFMRPRPTFHLEVWVLRKDLPKAKSIIEQMEAAEKAEWEDDE
jgi:hypothetical protein